LVEVEKLKILANIAARRLFLFIRFYPIKPNAAITSKKRL